MDKKPLQTLDFSEGVGPKNRTYCLKFDPNNPNILFSGGWDETLFLWDLRAKKVQQYIYGPLICGDSIDCKGNYVLAGSWRENNNLQIFDMRNLKDFINIKWDFKEKTKIYSSKFAKFDENIVIAGSSEKTMIKY